MNNFKSADRIEFFINMFFTLLLISIFAFPNAFGKIKVIILATIFTLYFVLTCSHRKLPVVQFDTIVFYSFFVLISAFWIFWGMLNGGHERAFIDAFKLYIIYSFINCALITLLQREKYMTYILKSILISTFIVTIINISSFAEVISGIQFYPEWFREELSIGVGIHDGYSDVSANNINSLFFLTPIIYALLISKEKNIKYQKIMAFIIMILCILTILISGRRALLILFFFIPIIHLIQKLITINKNHASNHSYAIKVVLLFLFPVIIVYTLYTSGVIDISSTADRLKSAFAEDTVRVDQFKALMDGFSDSYLLGSGFGGSVKVIRSTDRPWMYELTYMQLLFNGGLLGFMALFTLMGTYYIKALISIKRFCTYQEEALSILTGFVVFCIASASNPYFSSFDTMFILGTLPLISGWRIYHK